MTDLSNFVSRGYVRGLLGSRPGVQVPALPPISEAAIALDPPRNAGADLFSAGPTSKTAARQMGYTGDLCSNCSGIRMKVSGHCSVCEDCGTTTGCS